MRNHLEIDSSIPATFTVQDCWMPKSVPQDLFECVTLYCINYSGDAFTVIHEITAAVAPHFYRGFTSFSLMIQSRSSATISQMGAIDSFNTAAHILDRRMCATRLSIRNFPFNVMKLHQSSSNKAKNYDQARCS